jgi:uncharacterized OB-fold protein
MSEPSGIKGYICPSCSWSDVHETQICPRCHSHPKENMFSARGNIATFTVIRSPPLGFENQAPYVVALIDIENGPRVMGIVATNPDDLHIGQSVQFVGSSKGSLEFRA